MSLPTKMCCRLSPKPVSSENCESFHILLFLTAGVLVVWWVATRGADPVTQQKHDKGYAKKVVEYYKAQKRKKENKKKKPLKT